MKLDRDEQPSTAATCETCSQLRELYTDAEARHRRVLESLGEARSTAVTATADAARLRAQRDEARAELQLAHAEIDALRAECAKLRATIERADVTAELENAIARALGDRFVTGVVLEDVCNVLRRLDDLEQAAARGCGICGGAPAVSTEAA